MAKLKGVLKNAFGEVMPGHTIVFVSLKNTQTVLNTVISEIVTEADGSYEKNVYQGRYQINIYKDGELQTKVGIIELYADSPDADVNTYLTLPGEEEVTPEFIQQVIELKNQAIQASDSAVLAANQVATDKTDITAMRDQVASAQVEVNDNAVIAKNSAEAAEAARAEVETNSTTVADLAVQVSEDSTQVSADASQVAADKISAQQSAQDAADSASSIDPGSIVKTINNEAPVNNNINITLDKYFIDIAGGNTDLASYLRARSIVVNPRDKFFSGGAVGDWNQTTSTGNDDTAAIQGAINYLATLPNMRNAGVRAVDMGAGSFMHKGLTVPQSFSFGFSMIGSVWNSCNIYCNVDNPETTAGILLQCEFARFTDIRFIGSSKDSNTDPAICCDVIKSKLGDMRADCDVSTQGCFFVSARACIKLYGRGLLVDGCAFNGCESGVEIVADPTQLWPTGADQGNGPKSGMRNYRISNVRTDGCKYLLSVSGTGSQKDYINGVIIQGIDIYSSSAMINIPDATLRNLVVNGVAGQEACPLGLVTGKSINGAIFSNLATSKSITRDEVITGGNPAMQGLFNMTGSLDNIIVNAADLGPIRNKLITIGAESSNISMTNINFHRLFSASDESATNVILVSGANVKGFYANAWNITGIPNANVLACVPEVQTSNRFRMENINCNFTIGNLPPTRTANVFFGATQVTPVLAQYTVDYLGQSVRIRGALNVSSAGQAAGQVLSMQTGLNLSSMFASQTSGCAGGGVCYYQAVGSGGTIVECGTCQISPAGNISFQKSSNGASLTSTDMGVSAIVHAFQFEIVAKINPSTFQ